ncbi:hypothetical protein [Pseudooceanicola nanhaiensis]|uniref:hypothetical protein n=1 Tax=Pseudooceanicola nanhaiensis TaxID=375761 RepID=UPI001CD7DC5F|nr:hypothetical protein [Pseudooceanicola nanhaiensis]MCA0919240.1 hypothetical protein [Pseudooceanicola nanhaiensis]
MGRGFNWRALKAHRVYTLDEVCVALRCGPSTLKRILQEEKVQVIDEQAPFLVIGADLIPALRSRSKKEALAPGQMFCLGCKSPSFPDAGLVDDVSKPKQPPLLQALCSGCGAVMSRRVARDQLDVFLKAASQR